MLSVQWFDATRFIARGLVQEDMRLCALFAKIRASRS